MTDRIVLQMFATIEHVNHISAPGNRAILMIANSRPNSSNKAAITQTALIATAPGSDMLTQSQWTVTAQFLRLTKREQEVCQRLFEGNTRNEIANQLGIKPRTVRHYMEHIHEKLAVSNRVGVVLRIIQMRDKLERSNQTVVETVL